MTTDIQHTNFNEEFRKEMKVKIEKSNRKIRNKAMQRIIELLSSSTAHGIPNILNARNLAFKIIWLIVFIISTCAGSYFVIDSVLDYLKFQSITSLEVIQENRSQFPTLSFCGSPAFNNFTIDQLILSARF